MDADGLIGWGRRASPTRLQPTMLVTLEGGYVR